MLTPTAPESSRLCFRNRRVPFARTWYTHPSSPTFYICAWCFDHYISTSRFASSFTKSHRTIEGTCNFHPHRITRVLWPSVLETNDLSPLVEYMQHRAKIPPCLGMTPYTPSPSKPGVKWYIPPPPDSGGIDDFGACQACYEDYLCATPFAGRFTHDPSKTGEGWICDLAIPYTLRALLRRSPTNDWASFVSAVHHRMAKGLCTAQPTTTGTKLWYTVPGAAVHLDICEACYADSFAETPYADVVTMSVDRAGDGWTSIKCDMAGYGPLLDLVFALDAQHAHPDAFRQPLLAIAAAPRCHRADPIIDGLFYNFAPAPVDEFGVCEACYAGVITPLGMAYTLAPSPERVQGRFWCAFNPRMLQLRRFVDALNAEIDSPRSNAGVFEAAARKWMSIMPCPKRDTVPGGQGHEWWGWPDCPVCHECYEDVVRGTALEGEMAFRGVKFENPSPCALYSPAQRQRYLAACESPGNPEEFLAFCRERTKVYNDTVPLLTSLRQQAQADMDAAMLEQVIGHGLRMSDKITFGEPSSQYRSSATGNLYNSYGGVQAERHQAESDRLFRRARDGERRARMLELEARWAQYE
ncbi:hypothetical protein QBC47DRAFT_353959 [Echria macrotheca]|uniref:Integral membrane protein n=1 Tax=Echria macrotheca TaxID=438768 RepID=A0AAJ0B4B0_9PEZI|nr:hypothetical protein QBC47DRAFT_353959 [Echria macrotheca]